MSAAEHTILSADAYVQEMLRAAEAQTNVAATEPSRVSQARRRGRRRPGARVLHRRPRHCAGEHQRQRARLRAECLPAHRAGRQHSHLCKESGNRPGREDVVADDRRGRARCRLVEGARRAGADRIRRSTAGKAPAARARFRPAGTSCAAPARRRARCSFPPLPKNGASARASARPRTAPSCTSRAIAGSATASSRTRLQRCPCPTRSR